MVSALKHAVDHVYISETHPLPAAFSHWQSLEVDPSPTSKLIVSCCAAHPQPCRIVFGAACTNTRPRYSTTNTTSRSPEPPHSVRQDTRSLYHTPVVSQSGTPSSLQHAPTGEPIDAVLHWDTAVIGDPSLDPSLGGNSKPRTATFTCA